MAGLQHYVVEFAAPDGGWQSLVAADERIRQAANAVSLDGRDVHVLRSILVPERQRCFVVYEGDSPTSVHEAVTRSGLAGNIVPSGIPGGET